MLHIQRLGCNESIKLDRFAENVDDLSEEQGELSSGIRTMEERCNAPIAFL